MVAVKGSSDGNTFNPISTTDGGLALRQKEIMRMQDSIILDIESGVERLHGKVLIQTYIHIFLHNSFKYYIRIHINISISTNLSTLDTEIGIDDMT